MEQNYVTVTLCIRSLIFNIFIVFCQPSYLNIRRTDLHEICTVGRILKVDERPEVIFSIPQGRLHRQPILWAESTPLRY